MPLHGVLLLFTLVVCTVAEPSSLLKIFVVPHSHCDPDWIVSFDDYYKHKVEAILTTTLTTLYRDTSSPLKKFVWSETSFFQRWYHENKDKPPEGTRGYNWKTIIRQLLQTGQLEFVGGGWVQHDEALVTMDAALQQMRHGHDWLQQNFGYKPRAAWQIDTFGHSSLTPSIFAAMGMDSLVLNRIPFTTRQTWSESQHREFFWFGDDNATLLTHVLFDHYNTPDVINWHRYTATLQDEALPQAAWTLVEDAISRRGGVKHKNVLILWGDDFSFGEWSSEVMWRNMGKLMNYINQNQDLFNTEVVYSTFSDYLDGVVGDLTHSTQDSAQGSTLQQFAQATQGLTSGGGEAPHNDGKSEDSLQTKQHMREKLFSFMDDASMVEVDDSLSLYGILGEHLPQWTGDFLPYEEKFLNTWTGFYSTRPFFKRLVRKAQTVLRTCELLFGVYYSPLLEYTQLTTEEREYKDHSAAFMLNQINTLAAVVAQMQHHDTITGTSTQRVMQINTELLLENIRTGQFIESSLLTAFLNHKVDPKMYMQFPSHVPPPTVDAPVFLPIDPELFSWPPLTDPMFESQLPIRVGVGTGRAYFSVALFEPITFQRQELITVDLLVELHKSSNTDGDDRYYPHWFADIIPFISVYNHHMHPIKCQVHQTSNDIERGSLNQLNRSKLYDDNNKDVKEETLLLKIQIAIRAAPLTVTMLFVVVDMKGPHDNQTTIVHHQTIDDTTNVLMGDANAPLHNPNNSPQQATERKRVQQERDEGILELSNDCVELLLSESTGEIQQISNKLSNASYLLTHQWIHYYSVPINGWGSGAYVFRSMLFLELLIGAVLGGTIGTVIGSIIHKYYSRLKLLWRRFMLAFPLMKVLTIGTTILRPRGPRWVKSVSNVVSVTIVGCLVGSITTTGLLQWTPNHIYELIQTEYGKSIGAVAANILCLTVSVAVGFRCTTVFSIALLTTVLLMYVYIPTLHGRPTSYSNTKPTQITLLGTDVTQVKQQWADDVSRMITVTKGNHCYVDIEYNVLSELDYQLVSRYSLFSTVPGDTLHPETVQTDNGRKLVARSYEGGKLLAGNYHPVPNVLLWDGHNSKNNFALLTQQPLGVGWLAPETLEFMLHREISADDEKGIRQGVHDAHPSHIVLRMMLPLSTTATNAIPQTQSNDGCINNDDTTSRIKPWIASLNNTRMAYSTATSSSVSPIPMAIHQSAIAFNNPPRIFYTQPRNLAFHQPLKDIPHMQQGSTKATGLRILDIHQAGKSNLGIHLPNHIHLVNFRFVNLTSIELHHAKRKDPKALKNDPFGMLARVFMAKAKRQGKKMHEEHIKPPSFDISLTLLNTASDCREMEHENLTTMSWDRVFGVSESDIMMAREVTLSHLYTVNDAIEFSMPPQALKTFIVSFFRA